MRTHSTLRISAGSLAALLALGSTLLAAACSGATTTDDPTDAAADSAKEATTVDASVDAEADAKGDSAQEDGSLGDARSDGALGDSSTDATSTDGSDASTRVPVGHRATATACDPVRPSSDPNVPDASGPPVACHAHADCTAGRNGRCTGNGHDGWRCTYDECANDTECSGGKVCGCDLGFRSGADVCLTANCRVDGDCGTNGYCSPSLGSCGDYSGVVAYYCHTATDECIDDADCTATTGGRGYCAFESSVGHWKCSFSHCAG